MILEVDDEKGCKDQYIEVEKQTNLLLKKLFMINSQEIKNLKIAVIVIFDVSKGKTIQEAFNYTDILKKEFKIDQNLICRLEIRGK